MNTGETAHAYLFEAKGIGAYITDTGRLIDLIGGSDLVAGLCTSDNDDVLDRVLAACKLAGLKESRRAGGAFCLHDDQRDRLDRLRAVWRLTVGLTCPGLSFTDVGPGAASSTAEPDHSFADRPDIAALRAAYRAQPSMRENSSAFLSPTSQPVTEVDRRTGRVAVETEAKGGEINRLDGIVCMQRQRGRKIAKSAAEDRLVRLFLPETAAEAAGYRFPRHFDLADADRDNPAFPFDGRDRRIAVVHADISGLGQTFRRVTSAAGTPEMVRAVATAIEGAVARATRGASAAVLLPDATTKGTTPEDRDRYGSLFGTVDCMNPPSGLAIVPARPVILGGDDVTILVRADLAIPFASELLARIAIETKTAFEPFSDLCLPELLTACAGIAVVGAGHPFLAGNRMAEGLCKEAKRVVKAAAQGATPASALSFAIVTSTLDEDYVDWREREQCLAIVEDMTPDSARRTLSATACPYLIGSGAGGAPIEALLDLAGVLDGAQGGGKLIEAIALRRSDEAAARRRYDRFREVLGEDRPTVGDELDAALRALGVVPAEMDAALPFLSDARELIDIGALASARRRAARAAEPTEV